MSWLQVRLLVEAARYNAAEAALEALDALAITLEDDGDQPLFEPPPGTLPMWSATRVTGLFSAERDASLIRDTLIKTGFAEQEIRVEILEDKDWEREWMANYRPMNFGSRLWICPSWCEPPEPGAVNLLLDPGLAFGTGTHPTTAMCLRWLDRQAMDGRHVVDYGCGSGILGIAALLLGAASMTGIDNDPQALISTRANAERNKISENCYRVLLPESKEAAGKAEVVVANILAGPLIELAPAITALMMSGGKISLSGILETQADGVLAAYREQGVRIEIGEAEQEWVRLDGVLD